MNKNRLSRHTPAGSQYLLSVTCPAFSGAGTWKPPIMTQRIYRYRDFTITLDVESAAVLDTGMALRLPVNYLCSIRIRHASWNRELLPIHLIGEKGRPFQSVADAIFSGIRAAENAIDQVHANVHV